MFSRQGRISISHGSYIDQVSEHGQKSMVFALRHKVGALAKVLRLFQSHSINLEHIESRSSKRVPNSYEFMVKFDGRCDATRLIEELTEETHYLNLVSRERVNYEPEIVPWFPRRKRDLDMVADNVLTCGEELASDHPGFHDKDYRTRRKYFSDIARSYRFGEPIPRVHYNQREKATWGTVYKSLVPLYQKHACKEFNYIWPLMEQNCNYSPDNIPQLEDVSRFLKDSTGFTLRPVAGLLSSRDFLAGLAYRVFHTTQYIRHHHDPHYTPEPDVCHELLGHAPLFADPDFARLSQEIGLASIGAPEDDIMRLATCYWFTIEFGLCKQDDGSLKAYGAGLLSSYGELQYALSGVPRLIPFDPTIAGRQSYPITEYQPVYFVADSFCDAQRRLHQYATSIPRQSVFRYNPYTESIEAVKSDVEISRVVGEIRNELDSVSIWLNKNRLSL